MTRMRPPITKQSSINQKGFVQHFLLCILMSQLISVPTLAKYDKLKNPNEEKSVDISNFSDETSATPFSTQN